MIKYLRPAFKWPPDPFSQIGRGARSAKSKALGSNVLDLCEISKCIEQVQQTGVGGAKLALERVRFCLKQFGDLSQILKLAGSKDDKADVVTAATSGTTRHLLEFAGC
ncbi:MAG: hypothetical protein IPI76_11790 [Chloracidobacterium sp.]|nr:hypothetical protein [Chloracidobacterium sp.]